MKTKEKMMIDKLFPEKSKRRVVKREHTKDTIKLIFAIFLINPFSNI